MSNKIFRNFLTICCFIGFLWQTAILFTEFMNGKTVTNISVGVLHNQTLPGITICPFGLDFKQISMINAELLNLYEESVELFTKVNKSTIDLLKYRYYLKYYQAQDKFFKWMGDKPNKDTIVNYTTHIEKRMINVNFYNAISSGVIENDLAEINGSSKLRFEMISIPMETMAIYKPLQGANFFLAKCFTLFSHCVSGWSDIRMDFNKIHIQLSFDIESHSFFPYDTYPIAVHSPNNIPDVNHGFKPLKLGSIYKLGYSQWKIKRLGNGYHTNCRDYNPKTFTRSECIFECYQDTMRKIHNTNGFIIAHLLIRQDYFESKVNQTIANSTDHDNQVLIKCEDKCHKECQFRYYSFNFDKYMDYNNKSMNVEILVEHNEMPDLFIVYIPEMPLMTLICDFGGLLGMWLGASFLALLKDALTLIGKCTRHKCKLSPDQRKYLTFKFYFNSFEINSNRS